VQDDDTIGARIAAERRLRGLSQHQLAGRAHVSVSLLRKVEQGSRPASPGLMVSVARALGIGHGRLTGQPYYSGARRTDFLHDLIPELRRELTMFGLPPDEDPDGPPDLAGLAGRVAECSRLLYDVDYARDGARLPGLLSDLRGAVPVTAGRDRARVMDMLRETYDNAKRVAYDLGYPDLGLLAISNEERAAAQTGNPLAVAVTSSVRAWSLTGAGAFDAAYRLLVDTADALDGRSAERWSVWGWLNLQAALSAARRGDAARAWEHYDAAGHAASEVGSDRDDYRLSFGPTNVAIWGVGLAVEMQDGAEAVARAEHVRIPALTPRARAGHHFMDLARGHYYNGSPRAALDCLMTARRITPQQVRYNPMARETVYALARTERRTSESLRGLAAWMGVSD
jgi:transcriptional regulator with XRE-family HTH domain